MEKLTDSDVYSALKSNDFFIQPAAKQLGISRYKLYSIIKKRGICITKREIGLKRRDVNNKYIKHPKYKRAKSTYDGMIKRCYSKKEKCYPYYGGKGVQVFKDWVLDFNMFFEYTNHMDNSFCDGFSIDRINTDGDYEPGNIRFITHKEQCNNRTSNNIIEYNGKKYTLTELAELNGLTYTFLKDRIDAGFKVHDAIKLPKYARKPKYEE